MTTSDRELRRLLAALGSEFSDAKFTRTELPLILPTLGSAYALDTDSRLIGVKLSSPPNVKECLQILSTAVHLKRFVIYITDEHAVDFPDAIGTLPSLQYLWLSGNIRSLGRNTLSRHTVSLLDRGLNDPFDFDTLSSEIQAFLAETRDPHVSPSIPLERGDAIYLESIRRLERIDQTGQPADSPVVTLLNRHRAAIRDSLDLKGLFLAAGTKLEDPPLELVMRGQAALNLYFAERSGGQLPLNEVKVLLVGNGSAGKTSLVKQLCGDAFSKTESQTHGINIRRQEVRVNTETTIKLNFWDFGGQEIMHATHQFFLSKRSLYILVLDGRKEEDAEYWLQHIESFGGESPILVVLNKIDENPGFELNRRFLKTKYRGIAEFVRTSCATGAGLTEFKTLLNHELSKVAILQTPWPVTWFRVKERLETFGSSVVSLDQYQTICKEQGVNDGASRETLVDFLHDLGVILHFRDFQLLDTHVLDPTWVTEAVYRIINSEILAQQKGILSLNQLEAVLKRPAEGTFDYPSDKHQYIINLMLKFELCYELDDTTVLLPDLLDVQEPELEIDLANALSFVFEYTYLPKSVIPRFIVRMHRDIFRNKRWRTGVQLYDGSFKARAVVRADEKASRLYVSVEGDRRRDYFAVIRKAIADINSSFEKLGVVELVPLADAPGVLLDYRELLGYENAGRDEIFVGRLARSYNVGALLNRLEDLPSRAERLTKTVINVQGNYYTQATGNTATIIDQSHNIQRSTTLSYAPAAWEKLLTYATAAAFVAVVSFLVIRNEPISDPNLVVFVRILLSVVVALFGASVPGMLKIDLSTKGLVIRATGALALFVLAFLLTPTVL